MPVELSIQLSALGLCEGVAFTHASPALQRIPDAGVWPSDIR
jgi:hypothetical protein